MSRGRVEPGDRHAFFRREDLPEFLWQAWREGEVAILIDGPEGWRSPADVEQDEARRSAEVGAAFARRRRDAESLLAPFDAFQLLARVVRAQALRFDDPEQAPPLHGVAAVPEYLALLLSSRSSRAPLRRVSFASSVHAEDALDAALTKVIEWIAELYRAMPAAMLGASSQHQDANWPLLRVRRYLIQSILRTSGDETNAHADSLTRAIFSVPEAAAHVEATLGYGIGEALHMVDTIGWLVQERLEDALRDQPGGPDWLADRLSFTAAELSERADIGVDIVDAFLARFSLSFGSPVLGYPALTTEARRRPLLSDGSRTLAISIPTLRRTLRHSMLALVNPHPALQAAGRGSKRAYTALDRLRGQWLEERACDLLVGALRPDWSARSLQFDRRTPQGREDGEIDVIMRLDRTLVVVEAKAGGARIDSQRADPEHVVETLRGLTASEQHAKDRRALLDPDTRFTDRRATGVQNVEVPRSGLRRVLPITVTLDDISPATATAWHAIDAGVIEPRAPWIASLHQLETALDLVAGRPPDGTAPGLPAILIHFVSRRLGANEERMIQAIDEIDWIAEYLRGGLWMAEWTPAERFASSGARRFGVKAYPPPTYRRIDAYLMALDAGIPPASRPRPDLDDGIWTLLADLDASRPDEWLEVSLAVLDMRPEQRPLLASTYARLRRAKGRRARLTDIEGDTDHRRQGVTLVPADGDSPNAARVKALAVATDAARRRGADRWSAIAVPARGRSVVACVRLDMTPASHWPPAVRWTAT